MADSTFDRLVAELSDEQREEMLERLSQSISGSGEQLELSVEEGFEEYDGSELQERIRAMGILSRLWLLLRALFSGREQEEILEQDLLTQIARKVAARFPGLIDAGRRLVLPVLYQKMRALEQSSRICFETVGQVTSVNRGAFLSLLLEIESEEVRMRIESDIDPEHIVEEDPGMSDAELKRRLESNLHDILDTMPAAVRDRMYMNARFLETFRRLGTFDFGGLFALFHAGRGTEVEPCPISDLREPFARLTEIAAGIRLTTGDSIVRALYVFMKQQIQPESEDTREQEFEFHVNRFADNYRTIRRFFETVPLMSLAKVAAGTIHYTADIGPGGEDWFARLKQFWSERVDELFQSFAFRRRQNMLLAEATELCRTKVQPYSDYPGPSDGERGRFASVLAIIDAFLVQHFAPVIQPLLRSLQIAGDFYKESNKQEFDGAVARLREMRQRVDTLKSRIAPDGEFGRRLAATRAGEGDPVPVIREVDELAASIISDTIEALRSVAMVLNGILYGEVGGKYDTLSNLSVIRGRETDSFLQSLDQALVTIRNAEQLIARGYDLATVRRL